MARVKGRNSHGQSSEAQIQKAILDYCAANRIFCQRRNVGGMKTKTGFVRFGTPGQSDLWGIYKGRHWECEVKRLGEKPTEAQFEWLTRCTEQNAFAFWATSLDEFISRFEGVRACLF